MGLLTEGAPVEWEDVTKQMCDYVRLHGALQFLHQYKNHQLAQGRDTLALKWGEEIEYTLLAADPESSLVRLTCRAVEVLEKLKDTEDISSYGPLWHPEYANWMIEGTPGQPYGNLTSDLFTVEPNMKARRKSVQTYLQPNEFMASIVCHPRIGQPDSLLEFDISQIPGKSSLSNFLPDSIINPHPRFPTLTANIRKRRGEKVDVKVPLFIDSNTQIPPQSPSAQPGDPPHIHLDAMGFGMGTACLQMTFQSNMTEARLLYDQLAVLTPLMLALTAATPSYRGYLADTDVRWNQISNAVDDRTPKEYGKSDQDSNGKNGEPRLKKSRYSSIDRFISETLPCDENYLNDIEVQYNSEIYDLLIESGVDSMLSKHVSSLFVRDPLVMYDGQLELDDTKSIDHFENLNSTNWRSMRLKLPTPDGNIGWRVEFRTMEVQITDFENAAFVIFIVLITRIIQSFHLDLYMPISMVDENMEKAHKRNAVVNELFHFRRHFIHHDACSSVLLEGLHCCNADSHDFGCTSLYNLDEIFNGKEGDFPGLVPLVNNYLDFLEMQGEARSILNGYLELISKRAAGTLLTPATWMRKFVQSHPTYKNDSIVTPEAAGDLLSTIRAIADGQINVPELYGTLWPRPAHSPANRRILIPDLPPDFHPPRFPIKTKGTELVSHRLPYIPKSTSSDNLINIGMDRPNRPQSFIEPMALSFERPLSIELKRILKELRDVHPQYKYYNGLTICNHTYMTLLALHQLGAGRSYISYWYDGSLQEPVRKQHDKIEINSENWTQHLSKPYFAEIRDYLDTQANQGDRVQLLNQYVPRLISGVHRGMFHPIIRLGFSIIEEGNEGIVDALAYWIIRYEPMYDGAENDTYKVPQHSDHWSLDDIFVSAKKFSTKTPTYEGSDWIFATNSIVSNPELREIASHLSINEDNAIEVLEAIIYRAILLFLHSPSMISLHSVTGAHAVLRILPLISCKAAAVWFFFLYFLGIYTYVEAPRLELNSQDETEYDETQIADRWEKVRQNALSSTHVHVIKMVWTCYQLYARSRNLCYLKACEWQVTNGRAWQHIASRPSSPLK